MEWPVGGAWEEATQTSSGLCLNMLLQAMPPEEEPTKPVEVGQEELMEPVEGPQEEPTEPVVVPQEEPTEPTVPEASPRAVSPFLTLCLVPVPVLFVLLLLLLCIWCYKKVSEPYPHNQVLQHHLRYPGTCLPQDPVLRSAHDQMLR